jgi:undecaprenyl phosphate-alpha-L-ara4N flippase subunit ArnF
VRAHVRSALLAAAASVLLVSLAQLAMRWGMMRLPPLTDPAAVAAAALAHETAVLAVLGGLACYGVSMLCWLVALRALPLRVAYPLLSLSYVLVYVIAGLVPAFAEDFSWTASLGVTLVVAGVAIIVPGGHGD